MRTNSSSTTIRRRSVLGKRFEIVRPLGSGTVGSVYEALDRELSTLVALKVIHPHIAADSRILEKVRATIQKTRQLSHPNIVRVYDLELLDEKWNTISFELVHGCNLHELLRRDFRSGIPYRNAVMMLQKLLHALVFAHERGIPHLGLKPENILITTEGEIKLSDFSLTQSISGSLGLTRTGETSGSPLYMAPEQFLNEGPGAPADMYSVGVVLYELLVGTPPFGDEGYLRLADRHLKEEIPVPTERDPSLPVAFDGLIRQLCSKDPLSRPDAAAMLSSVQDLAFDGAAGTIAAPLKPHPALTAPEDHRKHVRLVKFCAFATTFITAWTLMQATCIERFTIAMLQAEQIIGHQITPIRSLLKIEKFDISNPKQLLELLYEPPVEPDWRSSAFMKAIPVGMLYSIRDSDGRGVLHYASASGRISMIGYLIDNNYLINSTDNEGRTALYEAVQYQNVNVANALLGWNARPDIPSMDGTTPIMLAVQLRNRDMVKSLVSAPYRYNLTHLNRDGMAPIHVAAQLGDYEIVRILLDAGAMVEQRDTYGRTALVYAALGPPSAERRHTIELLIQNGGSILLLARDNEGLTAYQHALKSGADESTEILAEAERRLLETQPEKSAGTSE